MNVREVALASAFAGTNFRMEDERAFSFNAFHAALPDCPIPAQNRFAFRWLVHAAQHACRFRLLSCRQRGCRY